MRKSPYVLTVLALLLPAILQFANWTNSNDVTNSIALWTKHHFSAVVLGIALAGFGVSALKELPGLVGFKKRAVQNALDQFIKEHCSGDAKLHRLTLFRRVSGFRACATGWVRLARQWGGTKEKRRALRCVKLTRWYLTVYARASDAKGQLSCAAFLISDDSDECQGMSGRAFMEGFCIAYDLPKVSTKQLRAVGDPDDLAPQDPTRVYIEKTHMRDVAQLHALTHPAYHFMGAEVRVGGKFWGVLLLDSEAYSSPFPDPGKRRNGGEFGKRFKSYAAMMSHFLS